MALGTILKPIDYMLVEGLYGLGSTELGHAYAVVNKRFADLHSRRLTIDEFIESVQRCEKGGVVEFNKAGLKQTLSLTHGNAGYYDMMPSRIF